MATNLYYITSNKPSNLDTAELRMRYEESMHNVDDALNEIDDSIEDIQEQMDSFISNDEDTDIQVVKVSTKTAEEYEELAEKDENTLYLITEGDEPQVQSID